MLKGREVVTFKTKHPTKEQKLTMVLENGEYIDPKDSVFSLARTDIGEYRLSKYDKINLHMLGYSMVNSALLVVGMRQASLVLPHDWSRWSNQYTIYWYC